MILTGKCKEDFNKWLYENDECYFTDESMQMYNNTLFIKWFDELKTLNKKRGLYTFKNLYLSSFKEMERHHSIIEIQKRVIIKANNIYNETFK